MKKDSFTFSDKLKKSKTLPLSKRIPSRVGGEVKAKRTLFERAQRDLPFIIVAALALLLLPFLSREAGDIDTPSVVWGDGSDGYLEEFNKPESAEGEIAVSSFRNPLDLIIRHGEEDSSAKDTIDTYGAGSGEGESSESDYSSRSSYGSEEYSSSPATSRYGRTVKRSVRNSVNRVPTAIGSLRSGAMVSPGAGSGVGHSMAFGSRARDAAQKVQGPGVRPVALQPLQAAGKGRNLTGNDALYAEAARSIGAMNTPGAKQALMDAQLADVDGKPLGDVKGGGGPGAGPNRPGAGGNVANNWNHSPLKPWWWDMMQKRSQMRWELWHYNWEKMVSDSLIKLTAGLASCLITGSPDFSVGKFLGSDGGARDAKCVNPITGEEVYVRRREYVSDFKSEGGKEKSGDPVAGLPWEQACTQYAHGVIKFKDSGAHKGFWETRLNCLGISLDDIKDKYENRRKGVCVNMYGDPMQVDIVAERNGKVRVKQYRKMGYYVMGKKGDQECAVAINHAIPGINDIPYQKGMTKVVVYRVGATGAGFFPEGNDDPTFDRNLEDYKNKKGNYNSEEEIYWESGDYYRGLREAEKRIQNAIDRGECLSEKRVQEILKTYGKWRDPSNSMGRFNTVATCGVPKNRLDGKIAPLRINTKDNTSNLNSSPLEGVVCNETTAFIPNAGGWHAISATIKNPGLKTIAVVLEEVQGGETASKDHFKDGESTTVPERSGFHIKKVIDFSRLAEDQRISTTKKDENGEEYTETNFIGAVQVGLSSTIKDDAKGSRVLARAGDGYVLWITTDDEDVDKRINYRNGVIYSTRVEDVIDTLPNHRYANGICHYMWGCGETNDCLDINKKYCRDAADGKLYNAVEYRGYLFKTSNNPVDDPDASGEFLRCEPLCKDADGGAHIVDRPGSGDPLPNIAPLTKEELQAHGIYVDPNCPFCNPSQPKNKPAGDGQCYIEDKYNVKHCYPSITLESHRLHYNIRISEEEITPCNAENPCWSICADKAKVIYQAIRNADDTTYDRWGDEPLTENPDDILPVKPGDPLCPYCNPNPEDDGAGKCYIGKQIYPSTSFVGIDGRTTYHIRTSQTFTSGQASYPCTPICAAKAKALGIFQTESIDSTEPVDPESPLTTNYSAINPVKPGTPLCPYCNPDPSEEPEQPEYTDVIYGPCEVQLIGEFFWNASYELKKQLPLQRIYEVMHDCDNPIIEGHASKTTVTDDKGQVKNNNKRLSFDRAMEVSRQVQQEWARHGVDLQVTPTSDGLGNYQGIAPDSRWVKYRSWPKRRNTISNPSNPEESVTIYGVGDRDAVFQRPPLPAGKKAWPAADEANYRLQESKDRKVIIKGTVRH